MIKIKTFEVDDLDKFEPKGTFEDLERDMKRNIMDITKTMLTYKIGDMTLAIVGVNEFRKGVGELWLLPSVHVDKYKKEFFKITKALIYGLVFPELGYHRLEIAILKDWKKGMRWVKALEFDFSHTCRAYDYLGNDHDIYYKVVM